MQPLYKYIVPYRGQKDDEEMKTWLLSHMKATDELKEMSFALKEDANNKVLKNTQEINTINSLLDNISIKIDSINKTLLRSRSRL